MQKLREFELKNNYEQSKIRNNILRIYEKIVKMFFLNKRDSMNVVQKIIKNTSLLILMQIVTMLLSLVFTAYLARYLGVDNFGKYSFALSFTSLFVIIVDLGFNQLTTREISRDPKLLKKYMNNIIPIKITLSLIFLITIFVLINFMKYPSDTVIIVYIFAIYTVLNSFGGLFKSVFNAFEVMEYISSISIIEKLIMVSCGVALLILKYDLVKVVAIYPIASFISIVLCSIICAKKYFKFNFEFDYKFWKVLILSSIPFGVFSIFITINYKIDTIMLSIMKGDSVVGWYNAAYTLVLALLIIPSSVITSLFPLLSRNIIDQKETSYVLYEKSLKYLIIIALPIVAGTIILADKIIIWMYGENFKSSIFALQILILSIIPTFMHNVFGAIILAINKEKNAVFMWALCATANVTLNYLFIPYYGLIGASITTLISEIIIWLQFNCFISKYNYKVKYVEIFYRPLIASLIMSIFLIIFRDSDLFLLIITGAFIYFICEYLMNGFSEDDIRLFKAIMDK